MIALFKKRRFNDYLNDTFDFFKKDGKHFFGAYFTINGVFLLLLTVFIYFISKVYFEVIFSEINNNGNSSYNYAETFLSENFALIIFGGFFFVLLTLLFTLINFAFPVIYLSEYEKNNGANFSSKEIFKRLKAKAGRLFLFFILSLFIIAPILMIIFAILILLCFIIIGIPLLMIAIPLLFSLMSLTLYHYLNNEDGFFSSIGKAFGYIFNQFWPIVGSTMIMYMIIQVTLTILSMIPYVIAMVIIFTSANTSGSSDTEALSSLGITMTILFVFTTILNYVFNNLLMINQGMMYYSRREHIENKSSFYEIDSIGNHFE
ncbi:hypothetical protein ACFPVY_13990 [Flavobacterium qiangtangense]|uniref:Glycerophosphoryl diester phosphodiesterase membrane domain-containing protein n=1 Tax=Flavobacterium qiangtangense TaxID=1442595 RepID=A0ABW1PQA7_9FLAO